MTAVSGDDAAMALLGLGADLDEFRGLLKDRTAQVARRYIEPLDELDGQVRRAEQELATLKTHRAEAGSELWAPTSRRTSATTAPDRPGRRS